MFHFFFRSHISKSLSKHHRKKKPYQTQQKKQPISYFFSPSPSLTQKKTKNKTISKNHCHCSHCHRTAPITKIQQFPLPLHRSTLSKPATATFPLKSKTNISLLTHNETPLRHATCPNPTTFRRYRKPNSAPRTATFPSFA